MTGLHNRQKCTKFKSVVYVVFLITCIVTFKTILTGVNYSVPLTFGQTSHRYLELDVSFVSNVQKRCADSLSQEDTIEGKSQQEADPSITAHPTSIGYVHYGLVKELPFHSGRLDSQRLIKIYDWVWTGENWDELLNTFSICLSTQGSLDRLHWMPELVQAWRGPTSLAVLIPSPEEYIGLNLLIQYFRKCYPYFRNYVSIHIALPAHLEFWSLDLEELQLDLEGTDKYLQNFRNLSCANSKQVMAEIIQIFQPHMELQPLLESYPQNHMRNIAKQGCGTEWSFSTDIDIIPRPDSATLLQEFILTDYVQECVKCAFVIPTFELDNSQSYPESKKKLVELNKKQRKLKKQLAQPFHDKVFDKAQKATNYEKWLKTNLKEEPIKFSHIAEKKHLTYYEPFYISPSNIPEFQERFLGYGFTRSSQIQEALAEGWNFQVLTPIFAIHWGLQNSKTLLNPGNERITRRKQTYFNGRMFKLLKKELELRKKLKREEENAMKHGTTPDFRKY